MYVIQYYYVPCCVVWLPMPPLKAQGPTPKPKSPKPKAQRGGIKWEEVYDAVDGTKTWYNTVTKKTTKIDPFF